MALSPAIPARSYRALIGAPVPGWVPPPGWFFAVAVVVDVVVAGDEGSVQGPVTDTRTFFHCPWAQSIINSPRVTPGPPTRLESGSGGGNPGPARVVRAPETMSGAAAVVAVTVTVTVAGS